MEDTNDIVLIHNIYIYFEADFSEYKHKMTSTVGS